MAATEIRGVGLHGDAPRRLTLSDGSRLLLDVESCADGRVSWKRVGWRRRGGTNEVSVAEARQLAGGRFSDYVRVRTRAEAEWMSAMSQWYAEGPRGCGASSPGSMASASSRARSRDGCAGRGR